MLDEGWTELIRISLRFPRFFVMCGFSCGLYGAIPHRTHHVTAVSQLIPGSFMLPIQEPPPTSQQQQQLVTSLIIFLTQE